MHSDHDCRNQDCIFECWNYLSHTSYGVGYIFHVIYLICKIKTGAVLILLIHQICRNMPDIDKLMQEWPAEFEELLKEVDLPTADLDCDLVTYVEIICCKYNVNQ